MNTSTFVAKLAESPVRIPWPGGPSLKQYFSFPESMVYYTAKNPSTSKYYSKIIQSCKYYFQKQPILAVTKIDNENIICSDEKCICSHCYNCCVKIDINKISNKFWLTNTFSLEASDSRNFISMISPKIYRCEIVYLYFIDKNIIYDDFKMLGSHAKQIYLEYVQIKYKNGSTVMLEQILEVIPNVVKFY
uniref:Uncharacterized protein n=1 Tax=Panagrolaimus sp. ES5 TaxID=591445 RepID=A0AC34F0N5_9BILA